jgi:hypothetical protein
MMAPLSLSFTRVSLTLPPLSLLRRMLFTSQGSVQKSPSALGFLQVPYLHYISAAQSQCEALEQFNSMIKVLYMHV